MSRRRAKGEGSVYQRKDGKWCAQLNGQYKYSTTEDGAKAKLYQMLAGVEECKPQNITVATLMDRWFEYQEPNLKPSTIKRYREAIQIYVKPNLGQSYRSTSLCADTIWPLIPGKQKTLTVPSDSEMVFRYGGQSPPQTIEGAAYQLNTLQETSTYRPYRSLKAQGSGVQRTISAELPPGEYVLEVSVEEQQGGAPYYFRVMVE